MSGIFRECKHFETPKQSVIIILKQEMRICLRKVEFVMKFYFPLNVKISIEDRNEQLEEEFAEEGTAVLEIASRELWNTENPYYYNLS